jgi:methylated-DNA-[protein]-cysteine S-methyltransferase
VIATTKEPAMPPPRKPRAPAALAPLPSPAEGEAPPPANRIAATAAVTLADAASVAELVIDSPIGPLLLVADDRALCAVYFPNHPDGAVLREAPTPEAAAARAASSSPPAAQQILRDAARQLGEYFAGTRREFELPLETGGTDFQQQVWRALCAIPFAVTWSYGQLATTVGNRNASRAVGAANGKNPIPIIVPCHRVIGSDGSLTGFGGGEATKRWLLDHEAKVAGLRLF